LAASATPPASAIARSPGTSKQQLAVGEFSYAKGTGSTGRS
jgi:hypothetical protein